jgi:hypothetical protein
VYLSVGNALMAFVEPGLISSTDGGEKGHVFQSLERASPELVSFLERVGALVENTSMQKTLTTRVSTLDINLGLEGISSIRLNPILENNPSCAVFLFGADFAPWERDNVTDALAVRVLPFGLIRVNSSIPGDKLVYLQGPMKSSLKALVYIPGQHPIWHILNFEYPSGLQQNLQLSSGTNQPSSGTNIQQFNVVQNSYPQSPTAQKNQLQLFPASSLPLPSVPQFSSIPPYPFISYKSMQPIGRSLGGTTPPQQTPPPHQFPQQQNLQSFPQQPVNQPPQTPHLQGQYRQTNVPNQQQPFYNTQQPGGITPPQQNLQQYQQQPVNQSPQTPHPQGYYPQTNVPNQRHQQFPSPLPYNTQRPVNQPQQNIQGQYPQTNVPNQQQQQFPLPQSYNTQRPVINQPQQNPQGQYPQTSNLPNQQQWHYNKQ